MSRFPGPERTFDDAVVGAEVTSPTVTVTGAMIDA